MQSNPNGTEGVASNAPMNQRKQWKPRLTILANEENKIVLEFDPRELVSYRIFYYDQFSTFCAQLEKFLLHRRNSMAMTQMFKQWFVSQSSLTFSPHSYNEHLRDLFAS